jgi:hypothetical protein
MKADRVLTKLNIKVCLARVVWLYLLILEFQRGLSFLFPICYVYVLFMLSISGLLFAFLHFTTVDFPVPNQRVSGFFFTCV